MHEHQLEEQNVTCYLCFLQDGCCISSSFLLCTRGFYILLGAPSTAQEMAIQACPQCPPRVSNIASLHYILLCRRRHFFISLVYDTSDLCRYATPFGLTSEYAHPAEILFLGFATVIGPALTGPHLFTLWLWMVLRVLETVEAHSGYHFPWSPSNFLPLYGG